MSGGAFLTEKMKIYKYDIKIFLRYLKKDLKCSII